MHRYVEIHNIIVNLKSMNACVYVPGLVSNLRLHDL